MNVLVACEFSGAVRDAFTARGHYAMSCDLLPSETPGHHYQGDVLDVLNGWRVVRHQSECDPEGDGWCHFLDRDPGDCPCLRPNSEDAEFKEVNGVLLARPLSKPHWDLIIAFPPCTYLASSGLHWNSRTPGRQKLTEEAIEFVKWIANAPCGKIIIENPIGCLSSRWRKPDQIIQPWQFGHDASKATCLWLQGVPPLKPTNILPGGKEARRANQMPSGQNKLGESLGRAKERSRTFPGIADAMAAQWG